MVDWPSVLLEHQIHYKIYWKKSFYLNIFGSYISMLKINLTEWLLCQHKIIFPFHVYFLSFFIFYALAFIELWITWPS